MFRDNGRKKLRNSLQVVMCLHKPRLILSAATVTMGLPIQRTSIQHAAGTRAVHSCAHWQQCSELDYFTFSKISLLYSFPPP